MEVDSRQKKNELSESSERHFIDVVETTCAQTRLLKAAKQFRTFTLIFKEHRRHTETFTTLRIKEMKLELFQ